MMEKNDDKILRSVLKILYFYYSNSHSSIHYWTFDRRFFNRTYSGKYTTKTTPFSTHTLQLELINSLKAKQSDLVFYISNITNLLEIVMLFLCCYKDLKLEIVNKNIEF